MADLKAGRVSDFANSLAEAMENAMKAEWLAVKGEPLPAGLGEDDRKIIFAAIAQGLLKYLHDHQSDLSTNNVHDVLDGHTHNLVINYHD